MSDHETNSELVRAQQGEERDLREFHELAGEGLLWLINTTVFHPRGYALALGYDQFGKAMGWKIEGDGKEPWRFANDDATTAMINDRFDAVRRLMP